MCDNKDVREETIKENSKSKSRSRKKSRQKTPLVGVATCNNGNKNNIDNLNTVNTNNAKETSIPNNNNIKTNATAQDTSVPISRIRKRSSLKDFEKFETPECLKQEGYEIHEFLGEGAYSKVYRATTPRNPNVNYAVKRYKIQASTQRWIDRCLLREMRIACTVRHPSIIEAFAGIKTESEAFLVLQYAPRGSINNYLRKLPLQEFVKERKVKEWASDLFGGVAYLHNSEICHRDIKCDNFLLSEQKKPLLADFSFACMAEQPDTRFDCMVGTICGTSVYLAPEVHSLIRGQKYEAKAVDVFALGVSLFEMFTKILPYRGRYRIRDPELVQKMMDKAFEYPKHIPISDEARQIMDDMLEPLPRNRPRINTVLVHKWFESNQRTKRQALSNDEQTKSVYKFRFFTAQCEIERAKKFNNTAARPATETDD